MTDQVNDAGDIEQTIPDSLNKTIAVPQELIDAGQPTDLPRDIDSSDMPDDQPVLGGSLMPELPEDNDTPFSPPVGLDSQADSADTDIDAEVISNLLDDTHPVTDSATDIDSTQLYNEGLPGAVEAQEPKQ